MKHFWTIIVIVVAGLLIWGFISFLQSDYVDLGGHIALIMFLIIMFGAVYSFTYLIVSDIIDERLRKRR